MKKSRLYLSSTVAGMVALTFISVLSMRVFGLVTEQEVVRPSRQELSSLSDFTAIEASGSFTLDIYQSSTYSVTFEPSSPTAGLQASTLGNVLKLTGYGNSTPSVVKIGMPSLEQLTSNYVFSLTVTGFDEDSMILGFNNSREVFVSGNTITVLRLSATGSAGFNTINLQGNNLGAQHLTVMGNVTVNTLPAQP